jgi:hypothetical protein
MFKWSNHFLFPVLICYSLGLYLEFYYLTGLLMPLILLGIFYIIIAS